MGTQIVKIVDYTAALAAGIEGVKAVFGAGGGEVVDPLRPGQFVATAPSNPAAAYTHWSDLPNAPAVAWESQDGTVELTWQVPMRLWLPKGDEDARRAVLPFLDGYLGALVRDPFLGSRMTVPPVNLLLRSAIAHMRLGGDKDWSWLDVGFMAVERVNYAE